MTPDELERTVLTFINDRLLQGKPRVGATDRLFEDGHLDSLRVLELIAFIEQSIGMKVVDRDIRLATFRSARAIARAFGNGRVPPERGRAARHEYHTDSSRFASPIEALR